MADIILLDLESTRDRDTEIEKYNGYCFLGVCVCVFYCVLAIFWLGQKPWGVRTWD